VRYRVLAGISADGVQRPKLGPSGQICVSQNRKFPATFGIFDKHGVFFFDYYYKTLPSKGAGLYSFAFAQYQAFRG